MKNWWLGSAALISLTAAILHIVGGGRQFHDPMLSGNSPEDIKAVFSILWHSASAVMILNGLALLAAALSGIAFRLAGFLVLGLNAAVGTLFVHYGLTRFGNVWVLPQWIIFTVIAALVFTGMARNRNAGENRDGQNGPTEVEPSADAAKVLPQARFFDAYSVEVNRTIDAPSAAKLAFGQQTRWGAVLLRLRNLLVMPFGLISSPTQFPAEIRRIGMFPVQSATKTRVVLGFDDKHLDFRLVVDTNSGKGKTRVTATTAVRPHNLFGRIYLAAVLPFHRRIVPAMLAAVTR